MQSFSSNIKFVKFEENILLSHSESNSKVHSEAKVAKEWHGNYKTAWQENFNTAGVSDC